MADSTKQFEHEAVANLVLEALGPERVRRGMNAYAEYVFCCRSWQSCFLAQALDIHEDVARHDPNKLLRIAEELDLKASDVKTFIQIFDNDDDLVPTRRLQEMCHAYLSRAAAEERKKDRQERDAAAEDAALQQVLKSVPEAEKKLREQQWRELSARRQR